MDRRRRGQAAQLAGSSPATVSPVAARVASLAALTEVLQRIPRAYQQSDFSAIGQAIRLLEAGDVSHSVAELERACTEMDACLRQVSAVYEAGFASALSAYDVIFDHVEPAREQVGAIAHNLRTAQSALAPATRELRATLDQLEVTEHTIALLTRVEALARLPDAVAVALEAKQWGYVARAVVGAVEELLSDELLRIAALEPLRKRMLDVRNVMPELVLAEAKSFVYLYNPVLPVAAYVEERLSAPSSAQTARAPQQQPQPQQPSPSLPSRAKSAAAVTHSTHRRGKSITAAIVPEAAPLAAAPEESGAQDPDAVPGAPVDRRDVPRYLDYLVRALAALDKATSSCNELALTADAAHRRLIEVELASAGRRVGRVHNAPPLRHALCAGRGDTLAVAHLLVGEGVRAACDKLAVVMMHHARVAAAPATAPSKYQLPRLWASVQRALVEQLDRLVRSSGGSEDGAGERRASFANPTPEHLHHGGALEAEDDAALLFRFSASSAAFMVASPQPVATSTGDGAGAGADPFSPSGPTALLASPVAPVVQQALAASPLHVAALHAPLHALLERVRPLLGAATAASAPPAAEEGAVSLAQWLHSATTTLYVPLLRAEYGRLVAAAFAAQDWARMATVVEAAVRAVAADARDAGPALAPDWEALAGDVAQAVRAGCDARLAAVTLHTMTARRLAGMTEADVVAAGGSVLQDARDVTTLAALAHALGALADVRVDGLPAWATRLQPALSDTRATLKLALHSEMRHQCYHHMAKLSTTHYAGAAAETPDADPAVRACALRLSTFLDAVGAAAPELLAGVGARLAALLAALLMEAVQRMERIDTHGALRMHMNVFHLQQRLSSSLPHLSHTDEDEQHFERVSAYYALVDVRLTALVAQLQEGAVRHVFRLDEYVALLQRRVLPDEPAQGEERPTLLCLGKPAFTPRSLFFHHKRASATQICAQSSRPHYEDRCKGRGPTAAACSACGSIQRERVK